MTDDFGGEDIRPLFFEGSTAPLFGCLQRPTGGQRPTRAVVLCPAFGHEYERSHRALRQLAMRLARAGLPSLRYDHAATGDSGGGITDGGPSVWSADIGRAVAEARRAFGLERVAIVGFRFGATLALTAAEQVSASALLLWRPVAAPARMLADWIKLDANERRAMGWKPSDEDDAILGWSLPSSWRAELEAFSPAPSAVKVPARVLGDAGDQALAEQIGADLAHDPGPPIWLQEPMDAIVPLPTLEAIVAWLDATEW